MNVILLNVYVQKKMNKEKKTKKTKKDKRCSNCKHAFSKFCSHIEQRDLAYGVCEDFKWSSLMKSI